MLVVYIYIILRFYKANKITSGDTIKLIIIVLFFIRYLKTAVNRNIQVTILYGKLAESEQSIKNIVNKTAGNGMKKNIPVTGDIELLKPG